MKALFEKVRIEEQSSLLVRRFRLPYFDAPWHYHPEYELTLILSGHGRRFVGDHIEPFDAGDLVLLGPDLPHFWRNDDDYYAGQSLLTAEAIVVQFAADLSDRGLSGFPEAGPVRQLLDRARYGLRFSPAVAQSVRLQLERLPGLSGLEQLLSLISLLHQLTYDRDAALLASDGFQLSASEAETERMKRVLEHMLTHFREEIRIEQIASVAGMASAAFCRYFRKRTGKSFVEYLNELRISHARRLLATADLSVGQVGLECGFNNISHFHRQFKLQTGTTPLKYQATYRHKQPTARPGTAVPGTSVPGTAVPGHRATEIEGQ